MKQFLAPLAVALAVASPASAQDAEAARDRGFIVGLIEDNLSAPGLQVRLEGFEGALSSQASLDLLQVSDDEGVWLRLEDVVLDWSRSALLRGRLEVEELSAGLIRVERAPLPPEGVEALPDAGASGGFSLPNLPVSVDIDRLNAERIELGAPLVGQELALTLEASAELDEGSGSVTLEARRLDDVEGSFSIEAAYRAETEELSVDLDIAEGEGGIAATLLQLPGAPAIRLTVDGSGPLDDFEADVAIASDGVERIGGDVTLSGIEDGRRFAVDLDGDVTSLFAPRYRAFFGDEVGLLARGAIYDDGRIALDTLEVNTQALTLSGEAVIGADGWPTLLDITGEISADDGTPVLLPVGEATTLGRAAFLLRHDASVSEDWRLVLTANDYDAPTLAFARAALRATGTLAREDGIVAAATGAVETRLIGLDLADDALARAVGSDVALTGDVAWEAGAPVRIADLVLDGSGYGLRGGVVIDATDPEAPLTVSPDLVAQIAAFSQFSELAGLEDLAGSGEVTLSGDIAPIAGSFDLSVEALARDLAFGIERVDGLLAGETTLDLAARRTVEGTFLEALSLKNPQLTVSGEARLIAEDAETGETSAAELTARIADGTVIDPRLDGPVTLQADLAQNAAGIWQGDVAATAPEGVTVSASGALTGDSPDITFAAEVPNLSAYAEGVPGALSLDGRAFARGGVWSVEADAAGPYGATAEISGPVTGDAVEIAFEARLPDLSDPVPAVADLDALQGPVTLSGVVTQPGGQWAVDVAADAPSGITARAEGVVTGPAARLEYVATVPEVQDFVPAIEGRLDLDGALARRGEDWALEVEARGPYDAVVTAETVLTEQPLRVDFTADIDDLSPLAPVPGGLSVTGEAVQTEDGFVIDLNGTGPYDATLDVSVDLTGPGPRITAEGRIPDSSALVPQLAGPLTYDVVAEQVDGQWRVAADVDGAQGISASVDGIATGPEADLDFDLSVANVAPFAPGLDGALDASGRLFQQGGNWNVDLDASGPLNASLDAQGVLTGGAPSAEFTLSVPDIGRIVPEISGPLSASGTATQQGDAWALDVDLDGPAGTNAAVDGTIGTDGTLDLSVEGAAPLGLANGILAPQRLTGVAQFDLDVTGPAGLDAVSGTIRTSDAALVLPTARNRLENIEATVTLSGGRAQIALTGSPEAGGTLSIDGPITLSAPFNADLSAEFDITLDDPALYTADLEGRIAVTGPLTGGATISGDILVDEAEIVVPASGLTAIGELPEIEHLGIPRPVQRTLARADQLNRGSDAEDARGGGGPAYPLDLTIRAPGEIFVRGRGLNAELGGDLRLTGTTANPIAAGGFRLIRGRLDLLGQRFALDEGSISFAGSFVPIVRLVATTVTDTVTASIVIEGPPSEIDVSFESVPELPEEEVVAQIFFGRDLSQLSPVQALQLANSIATLAGRGQAGLLNDLRSSTGLDDLDVTTDAEGNVGLRAGKYLSDNVYTDVQVDQDGAASISLNLDVTPNLTVRGATGAAGDTSLGVFFERDY
ncbi:hypothetical protein JSE7799_02278 [Jannaschia seosinensis]|uniref:Translocation and assembly module TamB C-terminal domain-containing protein n=1 Tax=Jannaschia seosinensis TaxID=313367 RepID=A0A0M7BAY0_9RHOB|nr:translocation/assembly module TamB domain-containing protein [Jannaschia seosinensis]CUH39551.1 hypothetical protein JSE7799_02278 [Jannaschia seosinensis]